MPPADQAVAQLGMTCVLAPANLDNQGSDEGDENEYSFVTSKGRPMTAPWVGCLHPGEMGSALAALIVRNGFQVCWTAAGRSEATRARAARAGLLETGSLAAMCKASEMIMSICPPPAALDVARQVAAQGYRGIYVDANAISPAHAQAIQHMICGHGGRFVDAAVVGPPPLAGTDTRLYLCGEAAGEVAGYFAGSALQVEILGPEVGRASAIKMCHSAVHKGLLALQLATFAAAEKMGVRAELENLFASRASTAPYVTAMEENLRRVAKAGRFAGEMDEVAQTLVSMGLPSGFHHAAAEIYGRLSGQENRSEPLSPERLFNVLLETQVHEDERADEHASR